MSESNEWEDVSLFAAVKAGATIEQLLRAGSDDEACTTDDRNEDDVDDQPSLQIDSSLNFHATYQVSARTLVLVDRSTRRMN